jgi:DNA polymerase-3 subunit beta
MKFEVERDVLAEAVGWVSRALPARPVIPVLSGMLLQAADGLTLSCFDYEVSARVQVDAEVAEPGTVLVPGRLLAEITRSLPSLPVEFADDPDGVSLTCGSASFTLVTLPVEEYPDLPALSQTAGTVDGGDLAAAVGQVAPAASRDDTLPLLTGVNLEVDGGTMTLAATDRYRLAVRDLPWSPSRPDISGAYLVPARTLVDAARTMAAGVPLTIKLRSDRDRDADLAGEYGDAAAGDPEPGRPPASRTADAMIGFESAGRRLTTRLIAGEYIKYRSRFPDDFACQADMPAAPFIEAVRRVSLVAERGSAVRLSFGGGEVTVEAETQGRARAREVVRADFRGVEPVIAFSPHFLLDGIAAAGITATAPDAEADASSGADATGGGAGTGTGTAQSSGTGKSSGAPKSSGTRRRRAATTDDAAESDAIDRAGGFIRLEFNSSTKPAVITGVRATVAGAGAGADEARSASGDDSAGPTAPDFRYLVVPLRAAAR